MLPFSNFLFASEGYGLDGKSRSSRHTRRLAQTQVFTLSKFCDFFYLQKPSS